MTGEFSDNDIRWIDVGDRRLPARLCGAGPTVVLLDGGAGAGLGGRGLAAALHDELAGVATVVGYDRAGAGLAGGWPRASVARAADDLAAVLDGLGVAGPVLLLAWSAGGLVAQVFAVRHPERVAGLVLLDPTAAMPDEPRAVQFLRLTLGAVQLAVGAAAAAAGFFGTARGRRLAVRIAGSPPSPAGCDYARAIAADARGTWQLAVAMPLFDRYVTEAAAVLADGPRPDVPVRVVVPRERTGLPPGYARRIDAAHAALAAAFPHGALVTADRASHLVPIDRPDLVGAIVREQISHPPR